MSSKNVTPRFATISLLILALLLPFLSHSASAQPSLPKLTEPVTVEYKMRNCLDHARQESRFVFNNKKELKAALWRKGEYCPKKLNPVNFKKYTLIGLNIRNPHCHIFEMKYKLLLDEAAKLYRFQVTHSPIRSICAGISNHSLWVLAPKLPEGYDVSFEITEEKTNDYE